MPPKNHIHDNQPHTKNQANHHQKHREKWVKCPLLHGVRKYEIRWSVKWEIANEGVSRFFCFWEIVVVVKLKKMLNNLIVIL